MLVKSIYPSPLGNLIIICDESSLKYLYIEGQRYMNNAFVDNIPTAETELILQVKKWLTDYFEGLNPGIDFEINADGTAFQKLVWRYLSKIPYGKTTTYGEIAKSVADEMGVKRMSAQAVGGAVGHNPVSIIVPCHRVLGKDGSLTGYAGGTDKKLWLLNHEKAI